MNDSDTDEPSAIEIATLRSQTHELQKQLIETKQAADARIAQTELKAEALRAGIVDLDGLKLLDPGAYQITGDGTVLGVPEAIAKLRRSKPWLFAAASNSSSLAGAPSSEPHHRKHATEMSLDEWRVARADLLRRR
jgi:hypothetical protein